MAEPVASPNTGLELLAGHLGNLTSDQENALAMFKKALAETNLYTPDEGKKVSHDDPTLLRFLRARSWNLQAAQKQFVDHENWLERHNIPKLLHEFKSEEMLHTQKFYPRWTGRRDKFGIPLFVYHLSCLEQFQQELFAVPREKRYQRVAALTELVTQFHLPLCTYLPHDTEPIPISSTTTIIDLEGVSFGLMWKLRSHLQEASRLNTENYPETIFRIAIVNSPSFFPTIWNWIKGWFDSHTCSKIFILGKDPRATLLGFIHPRDLPKQYGGELDWTFEDGPLLDEDAKGVLGELPKGPAAFIDGRVIQPPPLPLLRVDVVR